MLTYEDNIQQRGLPKWPAMVIVGDSVTEDQAAEIIIKTDTYFPNFKYASNDREFERSLCEMFGVDDEEGHQYEVVEEFRQKYGILDVEYLHNNHIVSAWIGGPHGWVSWEGRVFANTFNIGKWPDIETVAEEWQLIAEAFPYLKLTCQLFSGETCEEDTEPVVEYVVENGNVLVHKPKHRLGPHPTTVDDCAIRDIIFDTRRERGISLMRLKQKVIKVFGHVPQVGSEK